MESIPEPTRFMKGRSEMKKRGIAIVLLGCMMLTFVGCKGKSEAKAAAGGTGSALFNGKLEKNVTIQVL